MSVEKDKQEIKEYEEYLYSREVHLVDYLPDYFKENQEAVAFCEAADPEFNLFRRLAKQSLDNQSILTCDEQAMSDFEREFGIVPDPSLPLEERRIQVLAKMNETLPYTEIRLQRMLAAIVGWGHFKYKREGAYVKVDLDDTCMNALKPVYQMLERILPLNLYYDVDYKYESLSQVKFAGVGIFSIVIDTPINDSLETATVYHGSPYIQTTTIDTPIIDAEV